MTVRLAVFDVDGTLVDSRQIIHEVTLEAASVMGLPEPSHDAVRRMVGLSLPQALHTLAPEMAPDDLSVFVTHYQQGFLRRHARPGFSEPLYEGAEELLYRLKERGWLLSMATGKSRRGVDRWLARDGWSELFLSTHCADDGPGKPDPAMLHAAMEHAGVRPAQTVMIGDTSHDILMAVAAGARAQGVSWGFQTRQEVLDAGADHVADTFGDLSLSLDAFASGG